MSKYLVRIWVSSNCCMEMLADNEECSCTQTKMGLDVQPHSTPNLFLPMCISLMVHVFSWIVYKYALDNCPYKHEIICAIAFKAYVLLFCCHYIHICAFYDISYLKWHTLTPCASWKTKTICNVKY